MMQTSEEREISEQVGSKSISSLFDHIEEREELDRVLRHPEISRSTSLVRFLTFICARYFEDRSEEIREHSIAVEALGRKESTFDSQIDPIVRVTARALRKRLHEFYETEGKGDPIEIVIPLGRYIPQFVRRPVHADVQSLADDPACLEEELPEVHSVPGESANVHIQDKKDQNVAAVAPMVAARKAKVRLFWVLVSISLAFPAVFYAGLIFGRRTHDAASSEFESMKWGQPVWGDDFNGAEQAIPDPSKWAFETGNQNSWGNHEMETYCPPGPAVLKGCDPRHPNAFLDGAGHLVLRAQKDADGNWTSARITTKGLKNFQYGRIEARMKLPVGTGLWPAFWMLGANFDSAGWPAAGAVDIVENVGLSRSNGLGPSTIRSSLHTPGDPGVNSLRQDFKLPNGARVDDNTFHTYGILWSPGMIQFYVDDPANVFFVENASSLPEGAAWVFDRPFYLVMNLAVGGDWSGDPDSTTPSPSEILVDYIHVYRIPAGAPTMEWNPVAVKAGSMASSTVTLHGEKGTGRVYLSCATEPATAVCSLDASTVDFSTTDSQQDTVTISTEAIMHGSKVAAAPGKYKLTLTATTMSGDRSQLTEPFEISGAR